MDTNENDKGLELGPIKGLKIIGGHWRIVDENDFNELSERDDVISLAIKVNGECFGCLCSADSMNKQKISDETTVITRSYINDRSPLICRSLVSGPCVIYRNSGLQPSDVYFLIRNLELWNHTLSLICHYENIPYESFDP